MALRERGLPHVTPWDFIDRGDGGALLSLCDGMQQFWRRHGTADYHGMDCLKMSGIRHVRALRRLAWAAYVVRRAFERYQPRSVVCLDTTAGHGLDQPPSQKKMPVFHAVVRGMAQHARIDVSLLPEPAGDARFEDQTKALGDRDWPAVDLPSLLAGRPYVLFVGNGADLLRQLPIIDVLHRSSDFGIVQMFKSADDEIVQQLERGGHLVLHESQIPLPPDSAGDRWKESARSAFDQACEQAPSELKCVFANPYLGFHFDFVFGDYLDAMAGHVRKWRHLFRQHRPAALITNYDTPILDVACDEHVPCIVLPHGIMVLGYGYGYQALPERAVIGAISAPHRNRLIAGGIEPHRIVITGDPGFDAAIPEAHLGRAQRSAKSSACAAGERRRVLFLTADACSPTSGSGLPEVDFKKVALCFDAVAALAGAKPQWQIQIKPHPRYDHIDHYDSLNRKLPADRRIEVLTDQTTSRAVAHADAVVCPNLRTSAMFEASLHAKPVYLLDTGMVWCDRAAWGIDKWPRLASVAQLECELEEIFANQDKYRQRVRETAAALAGVFGGEVSPALQQSVSAIRQLVETSAAATPAAVTSAAVTTA